MLAGWPAAATPAASQAQELVAQLANDLASHASATEVLQTWCADRRLADPPVIVAKRQPGHDKPATDDIRTLLHAAADEPIRYRRVALACGRHVLSRADNWYRPGRLTTAMNAELDSTDHPFGTVVKPLGFHRESLEATVLIKPDAVKVPGAIIRNRALLETPDGTPFSLVVETYSKVLLDQGADRLPRARPIGLGRSKVTHVIVEVVPGVRASHSRHRGDRLRAAHSRAERHTEGRHREDRVSRRR